MSITRRIGTAFAAVASALALAILPGAVGAAASANCSTGPVGTSGSIPALTVTQRNWPLVEGLHMQTTATVNRNDGGVTATTRTYNSYWGIGYTGGVLVVLKNGCGDPIGVTEPVTFGVAAKAEFWAPHDRVDFWTKPMTDLITERAVSAEIVHVRAYNGRTLIDVYRSLRDSACYVLANTNVTQNCPLPPADMLRM
jgi:hypothetical protein